MRRAAVLLVSCLLPSTAGAEGVADQCRALLPALAEMNRTAPVPIDRATELTLVWMDCDAGSLAYFKRLTVDPDRLREGWRERKAAQHQELHCGPDGLARSGFSVADHITGPDGFPVLSLRTAPADCSGA